jgi:hypothetical protein
MQKGGFRSAGVFAWFVWLLVHIYFLSGFRNRLFVLIQWSWSYLTFARGTRLIVEKEWRSFKRKREPAAVEPPPAAAAPAPAPEPSSAPAKAESIRPPAPKASEVPPPAARPVEATRPPALPSAEEPVTRTWQAPNPPDLWEEPTTLYPSRE